MTCYFCMFSLLNPVRNLELEPVSRSVIGGDWAYTNASK